MLTIPYPVIDPVLYEIGPFAIRWYALAYIAGLLIGWRYCVALASRPPKVLDRTALDDFLVWVTLGVVLGGRVGYVLFYNFKEYSEHPLEALQIWHGGMSFHGGAAGVVLALYLFTRKHQLDFFRLGDILVCAVPIGLFLGRLANFVNGELYGRRTDVPWAMQFPTELLNPDYRDLATAAMQQTMKFDPRLDTVEAIITAAKTDPRVRAVLDGILTARHPSQLYEAFLEGLVLFTVLFVLQARPDVRNRSGYLSGVFLAGYALARIVAEFFREPDRQLGYLLGQTTTMGQILSIPVLIAGLWLIRRSFRNPAVA